jgi:hypothetical protein
VRQVQYEDGQGGIKMSRHEMFLVHGDLPMDTTQFPLSNFHRLRVCTYRTERRFNANHPHGPWKAILPISGPHREFSWKANTSWKLSAGVPRDGSGWALPVCPDEAKSQKGDKMLITYHARRVFRKTKMVPRSRWEYIIMGHGVPNDAADVVWGPYLLEHWVYHCVNRNWCGAPMNISSVQYIYLIFPDIMFRYGLNKNGDWAIWCASIPRKDDPQEAEEPCNQLGCVTTLDDNHQVTWKSEEKKDETQS